MLRVDFGIIGVFRRALSPSHVTPEFALPATCGSIIGGVVVPRHACEYLM